MLRPSDQEYKETKLIKLRKSAIEPKYIEFAEWINKTYKTEILNVYVDLLNKNCTRVQLIFDHKESIAQFFNKDVFSISRYKKSKIVKKYQQLLNPNHPQILLLIYAFEPLAKEEANTKIPLKTISAFIEKHKDLLWEVSRFGEYATFFLHTEAQLKISEKSGALDQLKQEYFELLKQYDELAYYTVANFNAIFDSKQNFDDKYDSSWRAYYN